MTFFLLFANILMLVVCGVHTAFLEQDPFVRLAWLAAFLLSILNTQHFDREVQ